MQTLVLEGKKKIPNPSMWMWYTRNTIDFVVVTSHCCVAAWILPYCTVKYYTDCLQLLFNGFIICNHMCNITFDQ